MKYLNGLALTLTGVLLLFAADPPKKAPLKLTDKEKATFQILIETRQKIQADALKTVAESLAAIDKRQVETYTAVCKRAGLEATSCIIEPADASKPMDWEQDWTVRKPEPPAPAPAKPKGNK